MTMPHCTETTSASGSGATFAARCSPHDAALLRKYDRPGPRYTSYPTAVEFTTRFDATAYAERLAEAAARADDPLSLYIHLPFCEARCTFCGCMVIATKKREVAARYLGYVKRELAMVAAGLGDRRRLVQHHWGGGTPTTSRPLRCTACMPPCRIIST